MDSKYIDSVSKLKLRFEERGIKFSDLRLWMKKHKIIAAGSYILQTLIDEDWDDSDLDVYILGDTYNPPPNAKLLKTNFTSKYQYQNMDIIRVTEWSVGEKDPLVIQIMSINPLEFTSLKDFIDLYDLDFCKVMFDGDTIEVMYPESIKTKSSEYGRKDRSKTLEEKNRWYDRKKMRISKYKGRGFNIY